MCVPVLFVIGVLAAAVVRTFVGPQEDEAEALRGSIETRLAQGRFEEARIAALRLAHLPRQTMTGEFLEAKALQGLGREKDSFNLLNKLAPAGQVGHAPAHVMLAVIAASQQPPDFNAAQMQLGHALQADPANQDAHDLSARLAGGRGDWAGVLRHLNAINIDERADLMLLKATALQSTTQDKDAVALAQKAELRLRSVLRASGVGNLGVRYSLAISLNLQHKHQEAIHFLMNACAGSPATRDRFAMADIHLDWSRHLRDQPMADKMNILQILEKGLGICPESQPLMAAFLDACDATFTNDTERIQQANRVLAGEGISKSFLHYYLGIQEWRQGSQATAREHFQLAHDLNPKFIAITNNLAMSVAAVSGDTNELERALALMEPLLRAEPDNPFFLDTRSQIHARLGRHREAARDLELALPRAQDKAGIHSTLSTLYRQLGMNLLSTQHGMLAGGIK